MPTSENWLAVYDFWFPPGLDAADLPTHWRMLECWMRGGANVETVCAAGPAARPLASQRVPLVRLAMLPSFNSAEKPRVTPRVLAQLSTPDAGRHSA